MISESQRKLIALNSVPSFLFLQFTKNTAYFSHPPSHLLIVSTYLHKQKHGKHVPCLRDFCSFDKQILRFRSGSFGDFNLGRGTDRHYKEFRYLSFTALLCPKSFGPHTFQPA